MSEKSDLRERAKYYINNLKGMSGSMAHIDYENGKGPAKVMEDLLQALDTVQGETVEKARELECLECKQLNALEIGRDGYEKGLERAVEILYETMGHLASPLAPYNHGVMDTLSNGAAASYDVFGATGRATRRRELGFNLDMVILASLVDINDVVGWKIQNVNGHGGNSFAKENCPLISHLFDFIIFADAVFAKKLQHSGFIGNGVHHPRPVFAATTAGRDSKRCSVRDFLHGLFPLYLGDQRLGLLVHLKSLFLAAEQCLFKQGFQHFQKFRCGGNKGGVGFVGFVGKHTIGVKSGNGFVAVLINAPVEYQVCFVVVIIMRFQFPIRRVLSFHGPPPS